MVLEYNEGLTLVLTASGDGEDDGGVIWCGKNEFDAAVVFPAKYIWFGEVG